VSKTTDRNFDDLADRFARRIYGGLKGQIRLAVLSADLTPVIERLMTDRSQPLRILDVGAGMGQLAIQFAAQGHHVTINDLSAVMLEHARAQARDAGVENHIHWHCGPYQELAAALHEPFDLVMCHALLEWLQAPEQLIPLLAPLIKPGAYLSLCFYNPVSIVYRNLIRGNFNRSVLTDQYSGDQGSLTPDNPCSLEQVRSWLAQSQFSIVSESGLRVFSDYVMEKRGGNLLPEQVLAMELHYARQAPYKWMGRYLHVLARRPG
jgi:S-adenosylmethionine-dependent methyltransferase